MASESVYLKMANDLSHLSTRINSLKDILMQECYRNTDTGKLDDRNTYAVTILASELDHLARIALDIKTLINDKKHG